VRLPDGARSRAVLIAFTGQLLEILRKGVGGTDDLLIAPSVLSADDVLNVAFSTERGVQSCHRDRVDALLDQVELELRKQPDEPAKLTSQQVRDVKIGSPPAGEFGYVRAQVDEFLRLVVSELERRDRQR
jgi:cell division septum initiation protein DivIVA